MLEGDALTEWSAMATIFLTPGANAVAESFSRGLADEIACKRRITFSEVSALLRSSLMRMGQGNGLFGETQTYFA